MVLKNTFSFDTLLSYTKILPVYDCRCNDENDLKKIQTNSYVSDSKMCVVLVVQLICYCRCCCCYFSVDDYVNDFFFKKLQGAQIVNNSTKLNRPYFFLLSSRDWQNKNYILCRIVIFPSNPLIWRNEAKKVEIKNVNCLWFRFRFKKINIRRIWNLSIVQNEDIVSK